MKNGDRIKEGGSNNLYGPMCMAEQFRMPKSLLCGARDIGRGKGGSTKAEKGTPTVKGIMEKMEKLFRGS